MVDDGTTGASRAPAASHATEPSSALDPPALPHPSRAYVEGIRTTVNVVADRLTVLHVGTRSRSRDFR